jgi:hypothetical protein
MSRPYDDGPLRRPCATHIWKRYAGIIVAPAELEFVDTAAGDPNGGAEFGMRAGEIRSCRRGRHEGLGNAIR